MCSPGAPASLRFQWKRIPTRISTTSIRRRRWRTWSCSRVSATSPRHRRGPTAWMPRRVGQPADLLEMDHDPHDRGVRASQRACRLAPGADRRVRRGVSAGEAGTGPPRDLPGSVTTVHQYELPLPRQGVWSLISEGPSIGNGGHGCGRSTSSHWPSARNGDVRCSHRCPVRCGSASRSAHRGARAGARHGERGRGGRGHALARGWERRMQRHAGQLAGPGQHGPALVPGSPAPSPVPDSTGSWTPGPASSSPAASSHRGRLDSSGVKFSLRQIWLPPSAR